MAKLPIHGFVLAGGRSSRMGVDKALLHFRGRPMIAPALVTLEHLCEFVSIAGNRNDLRSYGTVVPDCRPGEGPAAGIEAGLLACESEWAMFLPVDLPLLSAHFVRRWAEGVLSRQGTRASYVTTGSSRHPALCLVRKDCTQEITHGMDGGNRRLQSLLDSIEGLWIADAHAFSGDEDPSRWFLNVNTPEDLLEAQSKDDASHCDSDGNQP